MSPALAGAAAFERDSRAKHYPRQVAEGKIGRAAAGDDWAAWVAIAYWAAGERIPWPVTLAEMEEAASVALARREAALAAAPGQRRLAERRDLVAAIHAALHRRRAFIDEINACLRARAQRERKTG